MQLGAEKQLSESSYALPQKPNYFTPGAALSDSKPVQASPAPTNQEGSGAFAQVLKK